MIPLSDENPLRHPPVVTYVVLAVCGAVFLWQLVLGSEVQRAIVALGVIPAVLLGNAQLPAELIWVPAPATVLTSMFMHGGWMHFLGNMLYLWIFADNVEDVLGRTRFVAFYVACGIVAALAQALPAPESTIPMIGASGAISGVLGAYLVLFPSARVRVIVPLGIIMQVMRLPAWLVLVMWFGLQLLQNAFTQSGGGGVAFRAHIGGFVAGIVLLPLFGIRSIFRGRTA
jgi:membrane associated rhomboid family serine protease